MNGFDRLASDTASSATTLFSSAAALLREAQNCGPEMVREAARKICRAQPSMGALWNLAATALAGEQVFEQFTARVRRAPAAVTRVATALLAGDARRVITTSRSAIVEMVIGALRLPSVCAESRPGLEGRALAERLAQDSLAVTVLTDAAIGSAFEPGDVVLVGADAIAGDWFANKTGTGQLCAAATLAGVPAYVVSGREKCVAPVLAEMLRLREDDPRLVWDNPPAGVSVENVLFERIPLERVAAVITDSGLLAGGMIAAACESAVPQPAARALVELMQVLPDQGKAG